MMELKRNLKLPTNTIDQLQFVLTTIRKIEQKNLKMGLIFQDITECYRCLATYNYEVGEDTFKILQGIDARWENLLFQAKTRDIELFPVKQRFTQVTSELREVFMERTIDMKKRFVQEGPDQNNISLEDGLELMNNNKESLLQLINDRTKLVNAQKLFGIEITTCPDLTFVEKQVQQLEELFNVYLFHRDKAQQWSKILWSELDVGLLSKECEDCLEKLNCLPNELKNLNTFRKVSEAIHAFKESLAVIETLKNEALRDRHWQQIMDLTSVHMDLRLSNFTLGKLFDMNLSRFAKEISAITQAAIQERKIEKKLASIKENWSKRNFELGVFKEVPILADTSEMEAELEDDVLNLQTLLNSRFVMHFRNEVQEWDKNLSGLTDCIKIWTTVQQKWMYLEAKQNKKKKKKITTQKCVYVYVNETGVFIGSEDIRTQLKNAAKAFDSIHNEFKNLMENLQSNPNAVRACKDGNRFEDLKRLSNELDACQRSLSDYLESKRNAFPRFFFISDEELLSILGSSDPTTVQEHMLKLFVNCKNLKFRGGHHIIGMESSEGETFDFIETVEATSKVEKWMNGVQKAMRTTLHRIAKEAVFTYPSKNRVDWTYDCLGMVGILGCQIWWTWQVQDTFLKKGGANIIVCVGANPKVSKGNKNAMKQLNEKMTEQINQLIVQVRRSDLTKNQRRKINTLIIIDVHARDIVAGFVRNSVSDANEFEWESQLKFYWDKDLDDVAVRQCTGSFRYGYEYMGLNGRLVITPLTDRCVITLTQALTFHMGGAPAGPAGTGKTETVKDLAKALAIPCFVTNCGEGLDFKAMGSIFSGLIQIGAWGCFDEFNRIEAEVLSV
ncbi:Dynein heavy chain family protein, partial [Reticulomyxa filosa]